MKKIKYSFGQWLIDNLGEDAINKYWSNKNNISPFDISYGSNSKKVWIKCPNDNRHPDYNIMPNNFTRGDRCSVCSNHRCVHGINDIATTHPQYLVYFSNKEDAYNHTISSGKRILFKCQDCEKYEKNMRITDFVRYGFSCPLCGDGISYPNRFMANMLRQLNVDFIPEYTIKPNLYQYDFYLKSFDAIVEMHGKQHYEEINFGSVKSGRSLLDEQENDKLKQEWAIKNGIKYYIVIDCIRSEQEYISNNIINSQLSSLLDLSKIDWGQVSLDSSTSLLKQVCDLWNDGQRDIGELAKRFYVCKDTIRAWVKRGRNAGICMD